MMRKRWFHIFFAAIITLMMSGCEKTGTQQAQFDIKQFEAPALKPLKVGVFGPFTGDYEKVGVEIKAATELVFEPINYQIGDYKIELVYIDSESDTEKACENYENALKNKSVDLVFCGWDAEATEECIMLNDDYKIPQFFNIAISGSIGSKMVWYKEYLNYWFAKGFPNISKLTNNYMTVINLSAAADGWKPLTNKAVVYSTEDSLSQAYADAFESNFRAGNIEPALRVELDDPETDMAAVIEEIVSLEPDIIAGRFHSQKDIDFLNDVRTVYPRAIFIADGLHNYDDWYELIGNNAQFVLDQLPEFSSVRGEDFIKNFNAKTGNDPSPIIGGICFDYANFLVKVMQTTVEFYGELNSETLMLCGKERLLTGLIEYKSGVINSLYQYTADSYPDMVVGGNYFQFPIIQYTYGKTVPVWPNDVAGSEVVIFGY